MSSDLDFRANLLVDKIKHLLITRWGHFEEETPTEEFYEALSFALREEIMVNWAASLHTHQRQNVKTLYYLSMEYLPGRILNNNVSSLNATGLIKRVISKMHRDYSEVMHLEHEPGLGNGGLGRLASCFLDSLATLSYPSMGYGLRYQYGTFEQEIWDGIQIERPDRWLLRPNPWEFRRDFRSYQVKFCGEMEHAKNNSHETFFNLKNHESVRAIAFDIPIVGYGLHKDYSVITLRLWSTKESPRNFELQRYNAGQLDQAAENMTLTDVLYPNDNHEMGKRVRLKQEYLLVSASLQDILKRYLSRNPSFDNLPEKASIQINDTHPALVIIELMRILISKFDYSWGKAWEITKNSMNFTNHTIMKEALEEWNEQRFGYLLPRQYEFIKKLNLQFCNEIRKKFPQDEEKIKRMSFIEKGQIKMAHLAIYGSTHVNGVAKLHSDLLKEKLFPDFVDMFPNRFINVTNGVTPRRWLKNCNPSLFEWITSKIGEEWICDFSKIRSLANFAKDKTSQVEFLEIKRDNKIALNKYIKIYNNIRQEDGQQLFLPQLDLDSIFDIQIKRIHEYKRQLLSILHLVMLYHDIKNDPNSRKVKRSVIFGGKAAPGYFLAKSIIHLIHLIAEKINNDPQVAPFLKVLFFENYNVSKAEILIPAANLSEQISTAGFEASGTGNMKLTMNGALTIGTDDGANIEMREEIKDQWWPFLFGKSSSDIHQLMANGSYKPYDIYNSDEKIKNVLDSLCDKTFATNDEEHNLLRSIYTYLLEGVGYQKADPFFVLLDLNEYYETQKKVEKLYLQPNKWAETAIHNIAGMGQFSSDSAIDTYASKIWKIKPVAIDKDILQKIRQEYNEHDKCQVNFSQKTKKGSKTWSKILRKLFSL